MHSSEILGFKNQKNGSTPSLVVEPSIHGETFFDTSPKLFRKTELAFSMLNSAMIDTLDLLVPFKPEFFDVIFTDDQEKTFKSVCKLDALFFSDLGLRVMGFGVHRSVEGDLAHDALCLSFETVPSSHTSIVFKIFLDPVNLPTHIRIKASAAKVLQGHNVFGTISLKKCALELLLNFQVAKPDLEKLLDFKNTRVVQLDITVSAVLPSAQSIIDSIKLLKKLQNGQTKARPSPYENSVYFNSPTSKYTRIKAYGKPKEFSEQLKKASREALRGDENAKRVYEAMSDPRLQEFVKNRLRFEVSLLREFFKKQEVSDNLWEMIKFQEEHFLRGNCVFTDWWRHATKNIFSALEGKFMKVTDAHAVYELLRGKHFSYSRTGQIVYTKADRLQAFYNYLAHEGYEVARQRLGKNFYKNLNGLLEAGISKDALQSLQPYMDDPKRIFNAINVINIDFSNQRPTWYVEPVSRFAA